jgi:ABC-type nitrate/sulfonate/bicarbonate transport system substrate-binding protein
MNVNTQGNSNRTERLRRVAAALMLIVAMISTMAVTLPATAADPTATAAAPTGALQKVTLTLDWVPNTNHTGFYVALNKGWYRDQGLDVDIQVPSDPAGALKQVAYGHTEFGISFEDETTLARAQQIPVVSIAAILQHQTSAFVSLKGKGITRPKDFEGKKYAASGSILDRPIIKGLMDCDGGDVSKVDFVDVGFDALPALMSGKVDFIWIYQGWEGVQAQLMGQDLDVIPLYGSCIPDYYTPILITGETTIQQKPDVVQKFLAATAKGFSYAIQNPDESADILATYTPETDIKLIRASQKWLSPRYQADAASWGAQQLAVWQAFGKWMSDRSLLEGAFDAQKAFTNDFLPKP